MSNINDTFDKIKADDALKEKTKQKIAIQIASGDLSDYPDPDRKRRTGRIKRLSAVAACFLVLVFAGGFGYNIYNTEVSYADMDVNPSIELEINRFDRVIGSRSYNYDGNEVLKKIEVKHKKTEDAVNAILEEMETSGYLVDGELISVAIQSDEKKYESSSVKIFESSINHELDARSVDADVEVFAVTSEIRKEAHDHHMSSGKYLAYNELKEVAPDTTADQCRNHTIKEIKRQTQEHKHGQDQKHNKNSDSKSSGKSGSSSNDSSGSGASGSSHNGSSSSSSGSSHNGSSNGSSKHSGSSGSSSSSSGSGSSGSGSGSSGAGSGSHNSDHSGSTNGNGSHGHQSDGHE